MTVYALALLTIHDRPRYDRYVARFADSLDDFDGQLLAADEHPAVIEGPWDADKVVLIRFPDQHEFERWATSPTYQTISEDRIAATTSTVLLINGIPPRSPSTNPRVPVTE